MLSVSVGALVVGGGSFWVIGGVFALVMDFREVMLASPPELAHCAGGRGHSGPTQGVRPKLRSF